jgi:hypothetical protein
MFRIFDQNLVSVDFNCRQNGRRDALTLLSWGWAAAVSYFSNGLGTVAVGGGCSLLSTAFRHSAPSVSFLESFRR